MNLSKLFQCKNISVYVIICALVTSGYAQNLAYTTPYTFTTIASQILNGNGYADGSSQNAVFNQPNGTAVDTAGNIYVADSGNNVIRQIAPSGSVTTIAGQAGLSGSKDGNGINAQFGQLYGLAIDSSNNLYATDFTNNSVRKLVYSGATWTVSTLVSSSAGLNGPTGIAIDSNGNIYIADSGNGVIRKINSTGNLSIFAGSIGSVGANNGTGSNANFGYPVGIATDSSGNIYVTDSSADMIRKITPSAIVSTVAGSYGAPGLVDGLISTGTVSLSHPGAIACDSLGNLYFCDGNNSSVIRSITNTGVVSTIGGTNNPGGSDGSGNTASFSLIKGIAIDRTGSLYVTNSGTATIRKGTPPLVNTAPIVTSITGNITAQLGGTYALTATAIGSSPITYTWYFNGLALSNQVITSTTTVSTLMLSNFNVNQVGQYYVTATNNYGSSKSTITNVVLPISITTQPQSITTQSGSAFNFSVVASGTNPVYQWYLDGTAILGATSSTYSIVSSTVSSLGRYTVTVSNAGSSQTSQPAILTFSNPIIINQPQSITSITGASATFSVTNTGLSNNYQWYFNGNAIPGATEASLNITNLNESNVGSYSVKISNIYGNTTSSIAVLSIVNNPGRLVNLSVLTMNSPGAPLTLGFVNGGTGTSGYQPLLIRADGPALIPFGTPNVLLDPTLTLQQGSSIVATNDNWGSQSSNITAIASAEASTGAFPYISTSSLDAAMVQTLPSIRGGYTVTIGGNGTGTGNAMAEIFDNTSTGYTQTSVRLINLSCIQLVPVNGMLTAGFVIGGNTPLKVLIRASGPALSVLGVPGSMMADPVLTLVALPQQMIVATNSGWGGSNLIANASNTVGAFPFTNSTSKDSAILMTLSPGSYSAQVISNTGSSGKAMIEVYEVP